jgi:hypothetical protein
LRCIDIRHTRLYYGYVTFDWDDKKNEWLLEERGISFEQVLVAIESGNVVDILEHPNKDRFVGQLLILVAIDGYVYAVPTVVSGQGFFMKTIYPSRKYTERYLRGKRG